MTCKQRAMIAISWAKHMEQKCFFLFVKLPSEWVALQRRYKYDWSGAGCCTVSPPSITLDSSFWTLQFSFFSHWAPKWEAECRRTNEKSACALFSISGHSETPSGGWKGFFFCFFFVFLKKDKYISPFLYSTFWLACPTAFHFLCCCRWYWRPSRGTDTMP